MPTHNHAITLGKWNEEWEETIAHSRMNELSLRTDQDSSRRTSSRDAHLGVHKLLRVDVSRGQRPRLRRTLPMTTASIRTPSPTTTSTHTLSPFVPHWMPALHICPAGPGLAITTTTTTTTLTLHCCCLSLLYRRGRPPPGSESHPLTAVTGCYRQWPLVSGWGGLSSRSGISRCNFTAGEKWFEDRPQSLPWEPPAVLFMLKAM